MSFHGAGSVPYDTDTLLAEVYERLGDLQKFNGAYPDAICEYKCQQLASRPYL